MKQQVLFTTSSDGVDIGYATLGQGTPIVKAANWPSHLEWDQRSPMWRHWWDELSKDHMLVRYDQRGCGLSERNVEDLSINALVGDLETVVNVLGLRPFPLLGISRGGAVAIEYAVRHPEKVSRLILHGAFAKGWADSEESWQSRVAGRSHRQDSPRKLGPEAFIPKATKDQRRWLKELQEISVDPESAARLQAEWGNLDVLHRLSQLTCPVLVTHSRSDEVVPFEEGCRLAALIPGARFVPLNGKNHILLENEPAWPAFLAEVSHFLSAETARTSSSQGIAVEAESSDFLQHAAPDGTVTIMFTDIQSSTEMTERLGDLRMQEVLRAHNSIVRERLKEFGGFEVKSMGDGFMLAFSSARRALQCSVAMQRDFAAYNREHAEEPLLVRMGLHTGEVMKEADDFFGKHVILASRIAAQVEGGQILVSFLFKELTDSGGDIQFGEEQEMQLKGLAAVNRVYPVYWGELGAEDLTL